MTKKIFLDANVFIAMFRGTNEIATKAYEIIDDSDTEIVCSDALWLELMPKPLFNKNQEEVAFYEAIFNQSEYVNWNVNTLNYAKNIAKKHGIAAMDAIHIATAVNSNVDFFYTTEKKTKPMFRAQNIKVISLATE